MSRAPLPEARGSHVAAVIEINRAVAYSAKAASKERRRAKKIAKAKRKAEEHRREVMQKQELPVQKPKKPRNVAPGKPLPERDLAIIRDAVGIHGKGAIGAILSECSPHTGAGGIRSAIDKIMRLESDKDLHCPSRLVALLAVSARIQNGKLATAGTRECQACGAMFVPAKVWQKLCSDRCRLESHREGKKGKTAGSATAATAPEAPRPPPTTALATGIDDALMNMITNAVRNAVDMKLEERLASFGPRAAEVDERLRTWESVKRRVVGACKDDKKFRARWMQLRATFEVEHYDLKERAQQLGIDPDMDDWMRQLAIKQPVEFVNQLHEISRRLFPGEQPARSVASR